MTLKNKLVHFETLHRSMPEMDLDSLF
jgi:hypothetical protein